MPRPIPLLLVSTLLCLAGVFVLGAARSSDRLVGLVCIVFFGTCAVVQAGTLLFPSREEDEAQPEVQQQVNERPAVLLRFSFRKQKPALVGAGIIAAFGLAIALCAGPLAGSPLRTDVGETTVAGVALLGLAGATAALLAWRARSGLALTADAIVILGPKGQEIPWRWVADVALTELGPTPGNKRKHLALRLTPEALVAASQPGKLVMEQTRALCGWDILYPAEELAVSPERAEQVIRYYLHHPENRLRIGAGQTGNVMT